MKRCVKHFITVGTAVLLSIGMSVSAMASMITVSYNDMKVTFNDSRLLLQDGNGASVEPFVYDGTTYLPFRAIAQSLGLTVGWDSTTNTITLTGSPTVSVPDVLTREYPYGGFGEHPEEVPLPDLNMDIPPERLSPPDEVIFEPPNEPMPDRGNLSERSERMPDRGGMGGMGGMGMGERPEGMPGRGGMGMGERPEGMPERGGMGGMGMGERPEGMPGRGGMGMGERPEEMPDRGNWGEYPEGMPERSNMGERPEGMTPPNDELRERPAERPLPENIEEERPAVFPTPNPEVRERIDFNALSNATIQFPAGTIGDRNIDVTYSSITVVINGTQLILKDGNGNAIEPFISNGTTYLPLRAISQALGLQVDWDEATSTVKLGM